MGLGTTAARTPARTPGNPTTPPVDRPIKAVGGIILVAQAPGGARLSANSSSHRAAANSAMRVRLNMLARHVDDDDGNAVPDR